ncbi:CDK5 regulatory subunit-associated protein 2 isoform X5 [Nelusetta ayraudi]|uniref:CDK5 regulatory subunit-associated protein 2 isoform X5 n=1 Tax=Nelusetta ayraudi TaxID=303726 RepID=UPI003F704712
MRDLCRICGVRAVGSQCRWIFSSAAKRKLQVILSHVLGWEVTRDGRGEFLCGKCVFQLEKVVQCDVDISQLQDEHAVHIQKLLAEKDHLIQCIVYVYKKNNPGTRRSDGDGVAWKSLARSPVVASLDDEALYQAASEGQQFGESRGGNARGRMKRCVSLDQIASKGSYPSRSGSLKGIGLRGTRLHSQSMYLDLVQRTGLLHRPGFKGRSASLQSLNRDPSAETAPEPQPRLKGREPKAFAGKHGAADDPRGASQARALLRRSPSQPSVISDLIRLLRCISRQQICVPAGSHIPVLKAATSTGPLGRRHRRRESELKSLHDLAEEFDDDYAAVRVKQSEISRLESRSKLLTEELAQAKTTTESLTRTLEDTQDQNKDFLAQLEQKDDELASEKKNGVKRDKTIQGLTQLLKEKEKEIAELCHEIEDRDDALAKAREAAHKAQLQKYQGVEEHQTVLLEKQSELAQLQGEHNAKVLEAQKLQRALDRKQQELGDLQRAKEQLDEEVEDLQQQKKNGDKALNDLKNQLKKMSDEIKDRESALEQQYHELLDETKRKLQAHEVTIQRLTSTLSDKEQQLQEYINMTRDFEQNKSPSGNDSVVSKLRHRLKEKEKTLEQALDEKFAAIEEKDNEIHQLQLSLRERERDLDRLNNLLSHSEETINSFDTMIKEKDVELQHLANTLKNLQRAKQDVEDNLNRSLREKDSIISQLQLSLEGKTKDMEEMADSMLNQSQTQARDLAEQMGHRLKVTEAMLAEAVKARERLVADNESAVEGLLATISSKDQLLKESAERYNRMLFERAQEIQELRKQLSEREQRIVTTERQSSAAAQEGHLETAELRALLAEKDSIINKLLQRGQERDQFLADLRKAEGPDVLECRQTIQIMQEKLDDREAELSRRNSEDNGESIPLSKKAVVLLKKELAQKTEALNKALKRENELKMSLTELQSLLRELEGRNEGQAANIESLTATLTTKDEIIAVLHQRLGQRGDSQADHTQDQIVDFGMEATLPGLPQRERTMIGGDSQQEALPNLLALHQEHTALNKALKAEQQLYSSLVRTVKEQDSAQRLHALQLELTAVQLLREQLEEGIKTNEELRDAFERELQRAKLGEGLDLVDPKELESVRHQLEDAQRWNTSLQARLGAIQNRGGGVGGAKDSGDSLSFIGDQTSYMSICVGEGHDDSLSLLSAQELRQKVLELQDCVSALQDQLSQAQESDLSAREGKDKDAAARRPWKQQQMQDGQQLSVQDKECQTDIKQTLSGRLFDDTSPDSGIGHSRERAHSGSDIFESGEAEVKESSVDLQALKSLLSDCGATTVSHLREALLRLRSENAQLRGLLKEQTSTEWKEKESADASGNSSDVQAESKKAAERSRSKVADPSKVSDGKAPVTAELTASSTVSSTEWEESPENKGQSHRKRPKQHAVRHGATGRSRLPLPTRLRVETGKGEQSVGPDHLKADALSHQHDEDFYDSDQHVLADSDIPPSSDRSVSSSSQRELEGSEARSVPGHTHVDSDLFNQLELLHLECQEKEALINTFRQRLADWEEINAQLQEKDQMNRKYMEALQAAESTIAYLTACNLDSQGGFRSHANLSAGLEHVGPDASLYRRCIELQDGLNEKEEHNNQLTELLNLAERVIASQNTQVEHPEASDLCSRITTALQEGSTSPSRQSPRGGPAGTSADSIQELQRHADTLQKALWEQNRINAELQERLRVADAESLKKRDSKEQLVDRDDLDCVKSDREMTKVLIKCLSAAESTVGSLAAHCAASTSGRSSEANTDVQMNLDQLHRALQEKSEFGSASGGSRLDEAQGPPQQALHHNLCSLYNVFTSNCQRICELQDSLNEERCRKRESKELRAVSDAKGLPPDVQAQLETLHKALREKKKACKSLEERLATALTNTSTPENLPNALQRDDKGVQVDLQDLGYETSGKSENDREESSSTDVEVGVNPSCSASSLPSLLKHEQATFSSTENLDSTSSTPYPTSPALSSAKVSLKSLQAYDEYGASDDPHQLQRQVRELKVQLEHQTRLVLQMQSLLRHGSLAGDSAASTSPSSAVRDQLGAQREEPGQEVSNRSGLQRKSSNGESRAMKDKTSQLNVEGEKERTEDRQGEQLQQNLSRSTSPARLDSLVQSQARELSQLRHQIKESRRLGALQRRQLEELGKAFRELLEASKVDCYMGGVVMEQLDKSLSIMDRLEGRLDKGDPHPDNEDVAALELSRSREEPRQGSRSPLLSPEEEGASDSPGRIQQELSHLRTELEGDRELQRQRTGLLVQQHLAVAQCARERLELLAKELQEKNRVIQSLQIQLREQGASSHHSSHSDLYHSDRASSSSSSSYSSPATQGASRGLGQRQPSDWTRAGAPPAGGVQEDQVWRPGGGLQGLQRENGRLQEQLRSSEELNTSLRTELDLHRSIMAQIGSSQERPADGPDGSNGSVPQVDVGRRAEDFGSQTAAAEQARTINSDLLGEHLQEIRALRQHLEESIRTNDRLREQLEKRLAEVEKDPAATNIFIHGNEEQGQLAKEVRLLWGQNQALKEQLNVGSRDKQKENEKLRETLARRTAKLEQSRRECEALRQENSRLLEKLQHSGQENSQLQDTLQSCMQELHRLQSEAKLQRQQLSDSQRLLQSVRLELQVQEKIKAGSRKQDGSAEALREPVDLSELLLEIRHLRLQLERSIQTNTALRERLEEQLLRGHKHSETININYLLSSLDEGGRSPGREDCDRQSFQDEKRPGDSEADAASAHSVSGSSGESVSGAPSRLVPGHRVWANRNGRHVLGLVEDYSALRRQISEGRKLSRGVTAQLQECLHALRQLGSDSQVTEEQHLRNLSSGMNSVQQTLEEAGRLLKLVWRVSLPAGGATAGESSTNQQDELLKNEIARLKSRLTQQERMLSGAVKRLRTTNQLKEGMERVIIDQLSQTHGVLKKARGNLETNYCSLIALKGLSGGPDEGGSSQWPVEGTVDLAHMETPVSGPTAGSDSEASFNCSY